MSRGDGAQGNAAGLNQVGERSDQRENLPQNQNQIPNPIGQNQVGQGLAGARRDQVSMAQHIQDMDQEMKQGEEESHSEFMARLTRMGIALARNEKN